MTVRRKPVPNPMIKSIQKIEKSSSLSDAVGVLKTGKSGDGSSNVVFLEIRLCNRVRLLGISPDKELFDNCVKPFSHDGMPPLSLQLALPPQLSHVHDVFHVSLLRGYHYHPLHVASYPFDQIQPDMSLSEEPESILDRQERVMRNKVIPFVKILWKNHPEREATWETEESMRASYPHFFVRSRGSDFDIPVVFSLIIALLRNKVVEPKKSLIDEPPEVELKDLPPHLEYAFLEENNKLPVIIAKELSVNEKTALIKVLKSRK
ncbi:putative nucleotidyltransferase, ribonuclease H [Tanacetum coccineum]